MENRITPVKVLRLEPYQVFTFPSNLQGKHGAGAAKDAQKWGAKWGVGSGMQGQTYAIPTRDWKGYDSRDKKHIFENLPLDTIKIYIEQYIFDCKLYGDREFLTTPIGCGLAGYRPIHIAPMFKPVMNLDNVWLPQSFWDVLGRKKTA